MNKKLLAVAVAGALALPGVALAQSSVTISGYIKGSLDSHRISNANALRIGNKSETRVTDHSSRVLFNMVEDLGGGLQAVGQFDIRMSVDQTSRLDPVGATGATTTSPGVNPLSGGNNHVGLRSRSWGTIKIGRQDTHYGNSGDTIPAKSGHLGAWNSSVFDCVGRPAAGGTSAQVCMANLSRMANLMWWDSPNWGGFTMMLGMSTSGSRASNTNEAENDLGTTGRKGRAFTFNPVFTGPNYQIAWSHWNSKSDRSGAGASTPFTEASANAIPDEKSDSVRGHYIWGGLRVGLAWNRSKSIVATTGVESGNRTAWALPVSYNMGPHTFYVTYTRANDSKTSGAGISGTDTGAQLWALAYNYDLSKRTSVGVTYASLRNKAAGTYNLFYVSDNAFGGAATGSLAGEDPRLMGVGIRHNF